MAADLIGFSKYEVINGLIYQGPNATFRISPQPLSWGETATVTLYIANTGNAASGQFALGLYLSTDSTITTADTFLGSISLPSITTQQPVVGWNINVQMPSSRTAGPIGNYHIGMILDLNNVVSENSESNNSNQGGGRDLVAVTVLPSVASVADFVGSSTDKAMSFGSIINDGKGNASVSYALTLSNSAAKSLLKVAQNGVRLASGTNFKISSILSNKLSQAVNVSTGSSLIAANSSETWTIVATFDPTANGNLSDTLIIETDDPNNPTINVALSGVGVAKGNLVISDSVNPTNDQKIDFGNTAVDGAGGFFSTATLTLANNGSGPLTINQNSISVPAGPFSIAGIVSNTQGAINLATGDKTLAAANGETWTVTLQFDPAATGLIQQTLSILSNDLDSPTSNVTLIGTGLTPAKMVVNDSVLPDNDRDVVFGSIHADGVNRQLTRQIVTLKNVGQMPLVVNQNGLLLVNGTQFRIESLTSSISGDVNLASGSATIAPNSTETWTVKLLFDPGLFGSLTDTLRIQSNDLTSPLTSVSLTGTGLNQSSLLITDSDPPHNDLSQSFSAVLNDGSGGRKTAKTLQLTNVGNQDLLVSPNGITLLDGTNFRVASIASSIAGAINVGSGGKTLQARSAETWTVNLEFDPTTTGPLSDTLRILSNDPLSPATSIALSGIGAVPQVTTTSPSRVLNASAGNVYTIDWVGQFAPGNGVYSIYYDTDKNPASGLVPIATDLAQNISSYRWQVPTSLVGGTYNIYVAMNEAGYPGVKAGDYADGSIVINPTGTDRLMSAPVTDAAVYTLTTRVNGVEFNSTEALAPGSNKLYQTIGGVTREYRIDRVATLVDADHTDYDNLGNVIGTTDSDGRKTVYQYDLLSRLTGVESADGENVDYTYDVAGNLLSMHDATGWQLYTYDTRDRLTSVTYSPTNNSTNPAALRIGYEYDLIDQLTALVYPSGKRVEYGYTAAGNLNRVTEKNAGQTDLVTTYSYNSTTGLLTKMTRPNNTETIYGYDANGRLNDIHHKRTSTQATVLRYAYTHDAAGRRTGVVVTSETGVRAEKYVYDDFNRLTEVTYSDDNGTIDGIDRVVRYGYDKNDRRLTQTTFADGISAGATETLTYAYGFENRLLTVTDQNGVVQERFSYDQQGNQVQKITPSKSIQYAYNSRNLLTAVDDGLSYIQYVYDGAGRRVAEIIDGATNRLINDPSKSIFQVLEERQQNGSIVADYSYGLERVGGTINGQTSRLFYLSDSLGSVGALANRDGATVDTYRYDVFGGLRSGARSTSNPFLFTGERFSEKTGSIYLRNREYDVKAGGFLQKDPLGFVDGPSQYSYGEANPITNIDPLGTDTTTTGKTWFGKTFGTPLDNLTFGLYSGTQAIGYSDPELAKNAQKQDPNVKFVTPEELSRLKERNPWQANAVEHDTTIAQRTRENGSTFSTITDPVIAGAHLKLLSTFTTSPVNATVNVAGHGANILLRPIARVLGIEGLAQKLENGLGEAARGIDLILGAPFRLLSGVVDAISGSSPKATSFNPGGVLLDKAATLIDANLDDIAGASYDPATGQLVFLGSQNPGTLANVNLDLFATAIQSVFGSAVPPYVTLDPPAKLIQSRFNLGDGDGVILNGKTASVPIKYTPYTSTEIDDMSLSFKINGQQQTVRLNGWVMDGQGGLNVSAGGRPGQGLTLVGGVSNGQGQATLAGAVSGITYTMPALGTDVMKPQFNAGSINLNAGNSINIGNFGGGGYTFLLTPQTQDSNWAFSITNSSGSTQTISDLQLVPDRQHRKFGGRVDNTRLGWIIEEADRVMKALGIGKDHLTGATYNSSTSELPPGYQNLLERYRDVGISGNFNNRFWFTPNEQTLKRFIDPASGEATVVFDQATVKLNTEALVLGQPEDIVARNWAEYFNANYDAIAAKTFPVYDPDDPTQTKIINVKIFDELRNAMKAVSLARFFKDNNIPLDTWWLNSYQAPVKYTPLTIPTLTNSLQNGAITLTMHGGVSIKTPNAYIPDVVAKSIADAVKNQRPAGSGDLAGQSWNVTSGTSYGGLKAVATTLDDRKQDANITLTVTDLTFPSAGGRQLAFNRFYNSGYLIDDNLGRGWRSVQYDLQFQLPSYVDDAGLMRDSTGSPLNVVGADSDTRLRSGEIRIYDHGTGTLLDFNSSLSARYELDAQQNPIFLISGLSANKVPTFTPGTYRDGSSLTQDPSSFNYTLTRSDGSKLVFNSNGKLLQDIDSRGYTLSYSYTTAGKLSQIADGTNQAIRVTYGANGRIDTVIAPEPTGNAQRKAQYIYDTQGRLIRVDIQSLQGNGTYLTTRDTKYDYNTDNQLTGITGPDGVKTLTAAIDLTGRQDISQDALGNIADLNFTLDSTTGNRTTQTIDMGTSGLNSATDHGLAAIKYFAPGSTSVQQFDPTARPTKTVDALGNEIKFSYSGDLQAPTSITLPTPNRPAISVQRNSLSLPTVINDPANVGATPIQITYTAANKLDTTTDSKGRVTKYTYTAWHDVSTVTINFGTPLAATTIYNYNSNKLLASIINSLGQTVQSYDYDAFGNITKLTDADGVVTTVTYDTLGRLKRVFDPRLTGTIKFTEYFYNDNDQVTRIATPTGDITNVYDPITKRLVSMTDLTGTTTRFDYNTAGQLISETQVSSSGNAVTQYEYDRRGELVALTAPEGHRTVFRSDVLGRPTDVIEDNNIAPIASVRAIPGIGTNTLDVFVKASEPIVVASLKYWQEGQSNLSAITRDIRVTDQTDLVFNLTNIDQVKEYRYELTLTDRVGRSQTLPQAILPVDAILNLAVSSASVTEDGTANLIYTFSRIGSTTSALTVNYNVGGTATFNTDYTQTGADSYTATTGIVTFAVGSSTATVTIDPTADTTVEPDEAVILTLAAGTGYTLGPVTTATGIITNNDFIGTSGNDILNGTTDADLLMGLAGNDTYTVDNTGDIVTETPNKGTDTVQASISYTLTDNVENLTLIGIANLNGTGNSLNNILTGNSGNNTLIGNAGNDILNGGAGNDTLDGGSGDDTISGGAGNDIYTVDTTSDTITETATDGIDTVQSNVTFSLANIANVENLTLTGTAAINGTGNSLNNSLTGNTANNSLNGGAGADTLNGSTGIDTLDGGTGDDILNGGLGNDIYYVDSTGDSITEDTVTTDIDTVNSSINWTLGNNLEKLTLTGTAAINGTGNTLNNTITGNTGNNVLTGNDGNDVLNGGNGTDTLIGGLGNDTYVVDHVGDVVNEELSIGGVDTVQSSITWALADGSNLENLTLIGTAAINGTGNTLPNTITGNTASNTLTGGDGNDTINGGTGADTLIGSVGNDIYVVDNAGDITTEAVNEGTDTVQSSITWTLADNLENLTLTGTAAINGTGNALNNSMTGNSAANTLTGGDGNDTLTGGLGADTMIGGLGNDTYYVDNAGDITTESVNEGNDLVYSSVTWALADHLDNLTLTGTAVINGTGNALSNTITGNTSNNTLDGGTGIDTLTGMAGNDILVGGFGNDILTGGTGADSFRFNAPNEGVDTIKDFTVAQSDIIQILATGFGGGLVAGTLSASMFISGAGVSAPTNSSQRFIYNTTNGNLFFDADGNGSSFATTQIATLTGAVGLSNTNIAII